MAIPIICKNRLIYHFTDIENLKSIIEHGLLCTNEKKKQGISHVNIANGDIQERRSKMRVTCGSGGVVHDYVPFYFSSNNPMMLSVLNKKNVDQQDLIYLCMIIDVVERDDVVFTDASANTLVSPNFYADSPSLNNLNWELIKRQKWGGYTDEEKHNKMAEVLIRRKVDISEIPYIIVYNEWARDDVKQIFDECKAKAPMILYDADRKMCGDHVYYTKCFWPDRKDETLVTGPKLLKRKFEKACKCVKDYKKANNDPKKYRNIKELIEKIDDDFECVKELKEINDLEMLYSVHNETVGVHTRKVVENLLKQPDYSQSSPNIQNILKLSAYLHDIGKGSKSKWNEGKMCRPYPDHPADAIPMVARILSEEVTNVTDDEIRKVLMLVAYHDIVGDCLNKGRDKKQIGDVVNDSDEAKLLVMIAKADCLSIKKDWYDTICDNEDSLLNEIERYS